MARHRTALPRPERLERWSPEARLRYALDAAGALDASGAGTRDPERLWHLTAVHLTHAGAAARPPSAHTLRAYRRGVLDLLASLPAGEDVLRPHPQAVAAWVCALTEGAPREEGGACTRGAARGRPRGAGRPAAATVAVRLAAARALYAALRWTGATDADPFADVTVPRPPQRAPRTYRDDELERLLAAADDDDERLLVLLGADAGLRVSEMLGLRRRDVGDDGSEVRVRAAAARAAAAVACSDRLAAALRGVTGARASEAGSAPVLRLRSQYGVYRRMRVLCRRAGVPFRGVSALRQAAGRRVFEHTLDPGAVRDRLRYAGLEMARRSALAARAPGGADDGEEA